MTRKKRVTVVNDYPEFLDLVVDFLTDEGYEVTAIPKHQGAFKQIKESHPDVIICDIIFDNEPHGFGLIDMLYLDPTTRVIPLAICTAATQRVKEIRSALAAKGIRWLEKPFAIEDLQALIEEVLAATRPPTPE